jgi:glycosyltransferase involved in cell wall biosynthesis
MRAALVDPSLFTIPYDCALFDALKRAGADPTLYGRRLRGHEEMRLAVRAEPHFYRLSEGWGRHLPKPMGKFLKGAEHALDMGRLLRRFRNERPDILHFQWAPLPMIDRRYLAALKRVAPIVLTVHDTTPFNATPSTKLQRIGATDIFGRFDHLIVHSQGARTELMARGLDAARISVVPHGLLPVAPPSVSVERGAEQTILLFGKLKHYKGIDLLIEAFALLPEALKARARLRIVGEAQMPLAPLQARAQALGIGARIDWDLRYVAEAEIGGILAGADIIAFPYREIDTSGVLMAAVPYGKPIVASAIGAFAELLRDGVHGRLVPPEQPQALSVALADLLADPVRARAMGAAVQSLGDTMPSWDDIAGRTLALYDRVIQTRYEERPDRSGLRITGKAA